MDDMSMCFVDPPTKNHPYVDPVVFKFKSLYMQCNCEWITISDLGFGRIDFVLINDVNLLFYSYNTT